MEIFNDTLWIYTSIIGALLGASFLAYFKDTKIGIWCYGKLDTFVDYLVHKYDWKWLEQPEDAWRNKYPHVTKKIDELETRIKKLENGNS